MEIKVKTSQKQENRTETRPVREPGLQASLSYPVHSFAYLRAQPHRTIPELDGSTYHPHRNQRETTNLWSQLIER
jgi:hypothetical protein